MNRTIETQPGYTEASPEEMELLRKLANKPPVEGRDYHLMPETDAEALAQAFGDDDRVELANFSTAYPAEAMELTQIVNIAQGSPEWLAWRKQGIGASDLSAILGMSQYETPLSLWAKKTGFTPEQDTANENMEWGHRLETAIADKWLDENTATYSLECRGPVFERADQPWMRASLDALVLREDGAPAILECKTASNLEDWQDENGVELIPPAYMAQAIWQMAVTGIRVVHFSVLVMGRGRVWICRTITWDDDQIVAAVQAAWSFWQLVETQQAPEVSWTCPEADTKAIKAMFPEVDESQTFEAGSHGEELIAERGALKLKAREIDDRMGAIENEIKLAMGSSKYAKANGRKICTATAYDRESIDSKALTAAHPDIAKQFTKTTPVRTYRFAD